MLDPNKVKIGIAPIAWTEDDMPEMGAENSFLQTISEIALSGYVGTEIGCQYPRDPAILNCEFARRGISAITAWISTYLNEQPLWWNERAFVDHMNFLKAIGATIINTSDQSFSIQHQWNTPLANKKVLNDDEWEVLTKGLNHLGKIAYDSGMKIVYHHHMTTTVQTTTEIDRMLAMTDPKYVSMIYDTGHLTFSGEDPVEILKKHHDRISRMCASPPWTSATRKIRVFCARSRKACSPYRATQRAAWTSRPCSSCSTNTTTRAGWSSKRSRIRPRPTHWNTHAWHAPTSKRTPGFDPAVLHKQNIQILI